MAVVQNLFFAQGFTSESIATNAVVWTLSIEVFFYLLTPLLARLSKGSLVLIAASSLAMFLAAPLFFTEYYAEMKFGSATALLAWSWLAGFIAFRHGNNSAAALALLALFIIALNINTTYLRIHWTLTITVVAFAIGFADQLLAPVWVTRILNTAGDASYALYLFHTPVYIALKGVAAPANGACWLVAAIVLALALDLFFDQPMNRMILKAEWEDSNQQPFGVFR